MQAFTQFPDAISQRTITQQVAGPRRIKGPRRMPCHRLPGGMHHIPGCDVIQVQIHGNYLVQVIQGPRGQVRFPGRCSLCLYSNCHRVKGQPRLA